MNGARHPLLNDLVLSTLTQYVAPQDIFNFRLTCTKWRNSVDWKFRKDIPVNLTTADRLDDFLEDGSLQYSFENYVLSELQVAPLFRSRLFDSLLPRVKILDFSPDTTVTFFEFRTVLEKIFQNLKSLRIQVPPRYSRRHLLRVQFRCLQNIVWLDEDPENPLSVQFLTDFYSRCPSLRIVECLNNCLNHLEALGRVDVPFLTKLHIGSVGNWGLQIIKRNVYWPLKNLCIDEFQESVDISLVNSTLAGFAATLESVSLGNFLGNGVIINLPRLHFVDRLEVFMADTTGYSTPPNNLPSLKTLVIKGSTVKCNVLEYFRTPTPVQSVTHLEVKLLHEHVYENLRVLYESYPNVVNLTLGKPSRSALTTVWGLWELTSLNIMSGCGHIDAVITGISPDVCEQMVVEQHFPKARDAIWSCVPSIRDLTYLQVLDINISSECKSPSLSTLPTDVSVYYGLSHLPNLRNLTVHRSLISEAGTSYLRERLWSNNISPIQLDYDETIDAFQFHANSQKLIKLLCRYPDRSLHNLPAFMQMLYMNNQLDL